MASEAPNAQYSEPAYADPAEKHGTYPFYLESIDKYLTEETQKFLTKYSNIPQNEQSAHVHAIRDKAWAIRTYHCTGLGVWLVPFIAHSPAYEQVLKGLKAGATLLDIGTFIGSDLRQLCYDGAPSDKMYGIDIVSHWEIGFDMYRDRGRFNAHYIQADVMNSEQSAELLALRGSVDFISISAVMHQWEEEMQLKCATALVEFSKPGTVVFGYQIGSVEPKVVYSGPQKTAIWRHDVETFAKMWEEVGRATGTRWESKARLLEFAEIGWDPEDQKPLGEGARLLDFVVTRTS